MLIVRLEAAIKAVCPIQGVSIGNPAVKATWAAQFQPSATPAQQTAAQTVITNFSMAATIEDVLDSLQVSRAALAVVLKGSSSWASLTTAQQSRVQAVIDNAGAAVLATLGGTV